MIDVLVGLLVVYFLFAMVVTGLVELGSAYLALRSTTLKQAATAMLVSQAAGGRGDSLLKALRTHPLIASLVPAETASDKWPSYIPGPVFASALLELQFTLTPEDPLRKTLEAIYAQTGGDIEKQRAEVAAWFDGVMDRASGWYKRKVNLAALLIALCLAAILNLDSVALINTLHTNETLRESLISQAGKLLATPAAQPGTPATEGEDLVAAKEKVKTLYSSLQGSGIPLGWKHTELPAGDDLSAWVRKIAGILLTGVAGALGSPVWFELLSKIVSLRATGVEPKPVEPTAT